MTKCAPIWRLFLFLMVAFSLSACSQFKRGSLEDEKDPHFIEGKKRVNALDWDGAIDSFERALQSNPDNAAAHLELGIIYDTRKNDYGSAIYHYQRHLNLRTNSPMADVVKQNIIACKRELAKTVSYAVLTREVQRDLERLAQTNSLLRDRVTLLETELSRRPQYVTNYVTNFYAVPDFDQRGSASMTQPTRLITREAEPEPQRPVEPEPRPQPRQEIQRQPARQPVQNVAQNRAAPRPSAAASRSSSSERAARPAATRQESRPAARETRTATKRTHTVRPGETTAVLARKYGVSVSALKAANPGIARGVRAGQKIVIP